MKLVRDNDNRFVICLHITNYFKETFCFLRCKHCSRLIQNQNIRTSVKYLYNLQSLFLRYTHLIDLLIQIQVKMISVANSLCFFPNLFQIEFLFFIKSKRNILCGTEYINQLKMLVDHTDSQIISIFW